MDHIAVSTPWKCFGPSDKSEGSILEKMPIQPRLGPARVSFPVHWRLANYAMGA